MWILLHKYIQRVLDIIRSFQPNWKRAPPRLLYTITHKYTHSEAVKNRLMVIPPDLHRLGVKGHVVTPAGPAEQAGPVAGRTLR